MKEQKTTSILQRLPVILAVTAASYGLQVQAQPGRSDSAAASTSASQDKVAPADMRADTHRLVRQV